MAFAYRRSFQRGGDVPARWQAERPRRRWRYHLRLRPQSVAEGFDLTRQWGALFTAPLPKKTGTPPSSLGGFAKDFSSSTFRAVAGANLQENIYRSICPFR